MSIHVTWNNADKTALRLHYGASWSWTDHRLAVDVANALLSTVDHRVDLVVEIEGDAPESPAVNWHMAETVGHLHENWSGRVVIVSPNTDTARQVIEATPDLEMAC